MNPFDGAPLNIPPRPDPRPIDECNWGVAEGEVWLFTTPAMVEIAEMLERIADALVEGGNLGLLGLHDEHEWEDEHGAPSADVLREACGWMRAFHDYPEVTPKEALVEFEAFMPEHIHTIAGWPVVDGKRIPPTDWSDEDWKAEYGEPS